MLLQAALAILVMGGGAWVGARLLGLDLHAVDGEPKPAEVESLLLAQGVGSLAVLALGLAMPGIGLGRASSVPRAAMCYFLFLLLWVPVGLVLYQRVLESLGVHIPVQPHLRYFAAPALHTAAGIGALLVVCVVGPISEEILFRGYLQGALRTMLGTRSAILATAILFGLPHGLKIAFPIALIGLLFSWLRERFQGLAAPITAHILHNSVMVAVTMAVPSMLDDLHK